MEALVNGLNSAQLRQARDASIEFRVFGFNDDLYLAQLLEDEGLAVSQFNFDVLARLVELRVGQV